MDCTCAAVTSLVGIFLPLAFDRPVVQARSAPQDGRFFSVFTSMRSGSFSQSLSIGQSQKATDSISDFVCHYMNPPSQGGRSSVSVIRLFRFRKSKKILSIPVSEKDELRRTSIRKSGGLRKSSPNKNPHPTFVWTFVSDYSKVRY